MPNPQSGVTLRRDIADALFQLMTDVSRFVAGLIYPIYPTERDTASYPVIPKGTARIPANIKRAPKTGYARGSWDFASGTFTCEEYGFEQPVDDVEARKWGFFFDSEVISGKIALETLLRAREQRLFNHLMDTGTFTAHGVTNEWDDAANATPISDVKTGIRTVYEATGIRPDTLVIGFKTYQQLGDVDEILDRIKYVSGGVTRGELARELLAEAFGVRQVLVADAVYDSADEGQTSDIDPLWNCEYAMLCKVAEQPEVLVEPCIGRTFLWTADSPDISVMESYREEDKRSVIIRARHNVDEADVMTDCAYLFNNIVTT